MDTDVARMVAYTALVLLAAGLVLLLSWLLGQRHRQPGRDIPYESGVQPAGSARLRFGAHFYLVGVFFILFDIEAAILFGWAVSFIDLGWSGFVSASLFAATLAAGLVYIWKEGGLDWQQQTDDAPAGATGGSAPRGLRTAQPAAGTSDEGADGRRPPTADDAAASSDARS